MRQQERDDGVGAIQAASGALMRSKHTLRVPPGKRGRLLGLAPK